MCMAKAPKINQAVEKTKPLIYMRNPYLDGMGANAELAGRNSLRIDLGTPAARPPAANTPAPITPWTAPVQMNPRRRGGMPAGSLPATGLAMGSSAVSQPASAGAGMGTDYRRMQ